MNRVDEIASMDVNTQPAIIKEAIEAGAISEEERQRRRAAMNYAIASSELEGYVLSPESRAMAERFVNGEVSFEECINIYKRKSANQ